MRWEGRRESDNVEDRRGMRAAPLMVGGGGLVTIMMIIIALALGINPQQFLANMPQGGPAPAQVDRPPDDPQTEALTKFVKVVLADTEDVWNDLFAKQIGKQYIEPKLELFEDFAQSGCGQASKEVGPFYCPADSKVYLDLSFFEEMRSRFGAPGDFAMAYVIAHEVGHHVQNLLGISVKVQRMQQQGDKVEANNLSVRTELQADFLAGVWAHHAQKMKNILEEGDIGEAITAAQQIGDDTLQKRSQGRVVPDAFTHGSSAQRIRWFTRGLKTGKLDELNMLFEMRYEDL